MKIELPSFILEKINITNSKHLQVIKEFDRDYIVKKYLYPYKDSFYDLVSNDLNSPTVFNTFYIIYLKENNKPIGYTEIGIPKNTYINAAFLNQERGKGYGTKFLSELSLYLITNYSDEIETINTIVHRENLASRKTCLNSGFIELETKNPKFVAYVKKNSKKRKK